MYRKPETAANRLENIVRLGGEVRVVVRFPKGPVAYAGGVKVIAGFSERILLDPGHYPIGK